MKAEALEPQLAWQLDQPELPLKSGRVVLVLAFQSGHLLFCHLTVISAIGVFQILVLSHFKLRAKIRDASLV